MAALAFGRKVVLALVGITRTQLEHWDRSNIVKPSIKSSTGKGTRREYSFKDLVALKVAKRLRGEGIGLQKIRKSLAYLRKNYPEAKDHLSEYRFLTDGQTIFLIDHDRQKIIDTLIGGQLVISLALGELIEKLQGEVKKFATPKEHAVEVQSQTFTVVLTPDIEEGGFTVQCREEPAAISHGATEQEALDNVIDALELCLEHEREWQNKKAGEALAV